MSEEIRKLLSKVQVAEILGVPPRTMDDWRLRGVGPRGIKVGRYVKYQPVEVESWLDEQAKAG